MPLEFTLTPATRAEQAEYERRYGPVGFKLIPVELPQFPEFAGKRWEVVNKWMAELGAHSIIEMGFFLEEIGWDYYDILEAESP